MTGSSGCTAGGGTRLIPAIMGLMGAIIPKLGSKPWIQIESGRKVNQQNKWLGMQPLLSNNNKKNLTINKQDAKILTRGEETDVALKIGYMTLVKTLITKESYSFLSSRTHSTQEISDCNHVTCIL